MARTRITPAMQERALKAMRATHGTVHQDDEASSTSKDETVRGGDSVSSTSKDETVRGGDGVRHEDTSTDAESGLGDERTTADPAGKITENDGESRDERAFVCEQVRTPP